MAFENIAAIREKSHTGSCEQILLGSEGDLFPSAGLLVVQKSIMAPSRRRFRQSILIIILVTHSKPNKKSFKKS